jgi:hypothetical protein
MTALLTISECALGLLFPSIKSMRSAMISDLSNKYYVAVIEEVAMSYSILKKCSSLAHIL